MNLSSAAFLSIALVACGPKKPNLDELMKSQPAPKPVKVPLSDSSWDASFVRVHTETNFPMELLTKRTSLAKVEREIRPSDKEWRYFKSNIQNGDQLWEWQGPSNTGVCILRDNKVVLSIWFTIN